jgi:nitrate reductase (cytochrome), electron transfer subunit
MTTALRALLITAVAVAGNTALAQKTPDAPRLTGTSPPTTPVPAPPVPRAITDDVRRARNYPEQPPVIPHAIDGYQISLHANQCLTCHARQYIEGSGAPMISVTHFMDRDGQVLADVTPRRHFCNACHVTQADVQPLVRNTFRDALQPK